MHLPVVHRIGQVWHHLRPASPPTMPTDLACLLKGEAASQFAMLPAADQHHAIETATRLRTQGASEPLVMAGLLHDIGKAMPGVKVRVTDRIAKVVLQWLWPAKLQHLAAPPTVPARGAGLWVLSRHATVGAGLAQAWGYPARTCWLIAHHEDDHVSDPELELLIAADDGKPLGSGGAGIVAHG